MVMMLAMMMMRVMVVAAMKMTTEWLLVALDTRSSWSLSLTIDTGQCTALFTMHSAQCTQTTVHTNHSAHKTQCTQNTVHTAQSLMMDTALHCTSVPVTGDQTAPGDLLQGGNVSQQPGPVSISLVLLPQPLINVKKYLLRLNWEMLMDYCGHLYAYIVFIVILSNICIYCGHYMHILCIWFRAIYAEHILSLS